MSFERELRLYREIEERGIELRRDFSRRLAEHYDREFMDRSRHLLRAEFTAVLKDLPVGEDVHLTISWGKAPKESISLIGKVERVTVTENGSEVVLR